MIRVPVFPLQAVLSGSEFAPGADNPSKFSKKCRQSRTAGWLKTMRPSAQVGDAR